MFLILKTTEGGGGSMPCLSLKSYAFGTWRENVGLRNIIRTTLLGLRDTKTRISS